MVIHHLLVIAVVIVTGAMSVMFDSVILWIAAI